ncbi:SRPBCC domain-containing protein [Dactylosporangium sp. AC04546]|uniref:SRPBCC family protein n=1 Tax=Dactylosporangium sp. AC04546 TaxID=2862460 RepID=UPI001EE0FF57|nr:SRPBCC domain-containing protein [Dactylosporangium sp. AC04546]WVK82046.1 SRPBCC domain-containing protein [Dactylosporangium sp. AC04546]
MTGHEFELTHDITLEATPEQVWEAIATGPGIDSWFMGRNQVEPREGGAASMEMPGYTGTSTVTAWEPGRRFRYETAVAEDGSFMAFEYLIEGRGGAATALRMVHSGMLTGDWEDQFDALKKGNPLYLRSLAEYLKHFPGRTAVPVTAFGPQQADGDAVWAGITAATGLSKDVREGDAARLTIGGRQVDGVVDLVVEPSFLGIRTGDALLRFVGREGFVLTGHHVFADVDPAEAEQAWSAWLAAVYA